MTLGTEALKRAAEDLNMLIGAACDGDRVEHGLRSAVTVGSIQRLRSAADKLGARGSEVA